MTNAPSRQVLIVCDAAAVDIVTASLARADIDVEGQGSPLDLSGRSVVVWPEPGLAGVCAATEILQGLQGVATATKIVKIEHGAPAWRTAPDLLEWLRPRVRPWRPEEERFRTTFAAVGKTEGCPVPGCVSDWTLDAAGEPLCAAGHTYRGDMVEALGAEQDAQFAELYEAVQEPEIAPEPPSVRPGVFDSAPFLVLGSSNEAVYFLSKTTGRILSYACGALGTRRTLCTLAPPDWWKTTFGAVDAEAPAGWTTVEANAQWALTDYASRRSFDPMRIRGRGSWIERDRESDAVVHNRGDKTYLVDEEREGHYHHGYVYEPGMPLEYDLAAIASTEEAGRLLEICSSCSWEEPHAAVLLAGWIALAPICGALQWRPHIWITGEHGTGKSTVQRDIVGAALGTMAVKVAGGTTEAGIRQTLRHDSLPILVDEAEPKSARNTIAGLMELARSASSGDVIRKGSQGGTVVAYTIRSAFCFSAINPQIERHADESRITKLTLLHNKGGDEAYQALCKMIDQHLTPQFARRLAARMVTMAPIVRRNQETFAGVVTARYSSRRVADQLGTLLAGAYALQHPGHVTQAEAGEWVSRLDLRQPDEQQAETESGSIINHMGSHVIAMRNGRGMEDATINELVAAASRGDTSEHSVSRYEARHHLLRHGIWVRRSEIRVAKRHPTLIGVIFKGTAWVRTYSDHLRTLEGGRTGPQTRFGEGKRYQTISMPLEAMLERDDEVEESEEGAVI